MEAGGAEEGGEGWGVGKHYSRTRRQRSRLGAKKPVILLVWNFDVITPSRAQGARGAGRVNYGMLGAGHGWVRGRAAVPGG